jgi:mono/diheme cytochrome c family protein
MGTHKEGVVMMARIVLGLLFLAFMMPSVPGEAADANMGHKISVEHCEKCHGKTGKGDGELLKRLKADVKPVDWTSKTAMAKWSDADLAKIIKVGGKSAGQSRVMPSFGEKFSDADVANLVAYIRTLAK